LLTLRLEETVTGAAIGIGVALVVLPTSTRYTVTSAWSSYYTALGELLRARGRAGVVAFPPARPPGRSAGVCAGSA
jgi:hypothetical protein